MKRYIWPTTVLCALLIILGLFYWASDKISPQEIRRLTHEKLQEIFPGGDIDIGKIKLSLSAPIRFEIDKLDISINRNNQKVNVLRVNGIQVKVPLKSIFGVVGQVDIYCEYPSILFENYPKSSNWSVALGKKKNTIMLPRIFTRNKLNLNLKNAGLRYVHHSGIDRSFTFSKVLLKNFSVQTPTAFEIASGMKMNLSEKLGPLSFDMLMIGEFNLSDIRTEKGAKTIGVIKLSNIQIMKGQRTLPDIKTDASLYLAKDRGLSGELNIASSGNDKLQALYQIDPDTLTVKLEDINAEIVLKEVLDIVAPQNWGPKVGESLLSLKGAITFKNLVKKDLKVEFEPDLDFRIGPGVSYRLNNAVKTETRIEGSYKKDVISISANTKMLDGIVNSDLSFKVEFREGLKNVFSYHPRGMDVKVNNLNLTGEIVQELFHPEGQDQNVEFLAMLTNEINVGWQKVKLDDMSFSGNGKIILGSNSIAAKRLKFLLGEGEGKLSGVRRFGKERKVTFDFESKKLELEKIRSFLPQSFTLPGGTASGTVKGEVVNSFDDYDLNVDISIMDCQISEEWLTKKTNASISKMPLTTESKNNFINTAGRFENVSVKGKFKKDRFQFNALRVLTPEYKLDIRGNGNLYPLSEVKEGTLFLNVTENKENISKVSKSESVSKTVPVKLVGYGFDLGPDIGYTISKLKSKKTRRKQRRKK